MAGQLTTIGGAQLQQRNQPTHLPALIMSAGGSAKYAYAEFFSDAVGNDFTRRAYRRAVDRFLTWCDEHGLAIDRIPPGAVGQYVRELRKADGTPASKPTQKLHLAALRRFFDLLVQRHAVVLNPAASVRGPRLKVSVGKTPAMTPAQARALLRSIDTTTTVGLRDRAILAILIYTAARVGAVAKLRRRDFFSDGTQCYLQFDEKGGSDRRIPCRHDLQRYLEEYLEAVMHDPPAAQPAAPLFRTARRRGWDLSVAAMDAKDIHRMVKRRIKVAGLPNCLTCHSFRATTATDLLEQGVPLADVQELLGHADPRTTRLYDRRDRAVTRNVVERISI